MTHQDFQDEPARLEISHRTWYPRAVAPSGGDPAPAEPVRAVFARGSDAAPSPEPSDPPVWMPTPAAEERVFPLRARGADLRRRSHRHHANAGTAREELAVLSDYVRSAVASAERAGMRDPASAAAVRSAIGALRAAGDTVTAAMHTWSPTP